MYLTLFFHADLLLQQGLLAVQPRDVQLPGGLNITVPLPTLQVCACVIEDTCAHKTPKLVAHGPLMFHLQAAVAHKGAKQSFE